MFRGIRWSLTARATLFCGSILLAAAPLSAADPGDYWLAARGLEWWEWDMDQDQDGFTARQEYFFNTNPTSPLSAPPDLTIMGENGIVVLWPSQLGVRYALQGSSTLDNWQRTGHLADGDGLLLGLGIGVFFEQPVQFIRLEALEPPDLDGDGLSAVEEAMLNTQAGQPDTDADGLGDGVEVLQTFTNPLVPEPAGGTITGLVRTDPNRDGNTADGLPMAGATVWLDINYDGTFDESEPRTQTDATGAFTFLRLPPGYYHVRQFLEPGHTQTLPAEITPPILNSWPDEVVSYQHATTGADFPGPYGYAADRVWPGNRWVIVGQKLEAVDPSLLLKPAGNRYEVPPIGIYNTTDCLALPRDASVTLRFDELIVDKLGPDITFYMPQQGNSIETAQLWLGPTPDSLTLFTRVSSTAFVHSFDLANSPVRPPVQFIKVVSETSGGVDLGFGFTTIQALNFVGAATDARAVTIVGTETVSGVDFGRIFLDQPPVLTLEDGGGILRQAVASVLRLSAWDDIGLASLTATANGQPVALSADGTLTVTPVQPGTIDITGSATDTGGQSTTESWRLYVANPDGTLPFDPEALGAADGQGTPDIRVLSPSAGEVVSGPTPIVATIGGVSAPIWEVAYAPIASVDPYALEIEDPDYLALASGTGYRTSEPVAEFPGQSVENGIYLFRIKATPSGGGPTRYFGQIIAKGVDAASLQPRITVTSPADGTLCGLVQDISGSIESDRPLTEWFVEIAPRQEVDLNDLGSDTPSWIRLASGSAAVSPTATLARLDTSTLPNGSYVVRVVAWNDLRLGRVEARLIEVSGEAKFGRHRREFTDVEIDMAGFPLTIKRVFDSFDAHRIGDFGYAWSLALVDPQIGETVPRTGSGLFGQTAYRDGTRVYLTGPDGNRLGFTFHPELVSPGIFGDNYRATFTPDPGVYDRLEVPEGSDPFLTVAATGEVKLNFIGLAWNPDTFVLVRPDGTRYTYHETRGFLEARDLNGNSLTYTPDGFEHSGGLSLTFTRDSLGRIAKITDGMRTWTYAYSASGDLESVTDPDGRASRYAYLTSPAHYLASVTDPFGRVGSAYEYDADGRLVAIVDPSGHRTLQSWDPLGFTGSITDGRGNITQLTYDQRGNVLTATDPLGGVTRYAYADARHPDKETSITDPLGRATTFAYDAAGNQISIVRPGNFFPWLTTTWNDRNQTLQRQRSDVGGLPDTWEYDANGNLTLESLIGEPERSFTRTPEGRIQSQTVAELPLVATHDPASGLEREITDPNGFRLTFTRDASGRIIRTTNASGENVTVTHGADGLPRSLTDAAGATATTTVNPDGSLTVNDWNGRQSRLFVDAAGQLTALRGQDGFTITPERDANRNVTGTTDALGHRHTAEYDPLNRVSRLTDPTGKSRLYSYDAAGRLTEYTDRNGRKKRFSYNGLDQVTQEQWLDPTGTIVRTWSLTYATNLNYGRLDSVTDGQSTWSFQGSAFRPTRVRVAYPGQEVYEIGYDWTDNGGRLPRQVRLFKGINILHTVEAQIIGDRIYRHNWNAPALGGNGARHVRHYFDPMGGEIRLERFDNFLTADIAQTPFAVTHTQRDTKGRATLIRHVSAADTLLFPAAEQSMTRSPGGCLMTLTEPGNTATLSYDAGLQLTAATHTSRPQEIYSYDAAGNRLTSHFQPVPATIASGNRMTAIGGLTLEYDFEGNLIRETTTATGAIREFAYDHNNQLVEVSTRPSAAAPPTVIATYTYDFAGNRSSRSEAGVTTWTVYDRRMPVAEFRNGETSLRSLYFYHLAHLDRWFATWDAVDGERWHLQDHRQTVRGAIRKDATPIVWADYDAFGRLLSGDPSQLGPIRFTGRLWSEASASYDVRARVYSPDLGRFFQEDPSLFASGDLNLYRYAWNDPLNFTDPTGTTPAVEYAVLACQISVNALSQAHEIGTCVAEMLGAAALGLYGIQTGNASACVVDFVTAPVTQAMQWYNSWFSLSAWKQAAAKKAYDKLMDRLFGMDIFEKPSCGSIRDPAKAASAAAAGAAADGLGFSPP
ncbi:MAG: RHS repeat-associated core domain-containing protein [Verrucomicrobiales bacterium]